MSRFSRKIRNASKKLLYGTIIFSALNLAGSAFISCLDRNLPNPKSYKCNAYSLPYCNKPNSHYGKINVNGDGYIGDKEFPDDKEKNTYRIVIFGGSTSLPFCQTDKRDDAAFQLEDMLNANYKNIKFEVWNASVVGYSVREQSIAIRDIFGPQKKMDLAVIQEPINHIYLCYDVAMSWNDLLQFEKTNFRRLFTIMPLSEGFYRLGDFSKSCIHELKEDNNPYGLLKRISSIFGSSNSKDVEKKYIAIVDRNRGNGVRSESYERIKDGLPTVLNSLERIHDASKQYNFNILLGIMPMTFTNEPVDGLGVPFTPSCASSNQIYRTYYDFNEATTKTYEDFANKFGVPLVRHDISFEGLDPTELGSKYFCDFVHPKEKGHSIIAKNLAQFIIGSVHDLSSRRQNGKFGNNGRLYY